MLQTGDPRAGKGRRNLKVPDYDPSWDPLTLEYQVKWPLHLILTPQVALAPTPMSTHLMQALCCCLRGDLSSSSHMLSEKELIQFKRASLLVPYHLL